MLGKFKLIKDFTELFFKLIPKAQKKEFGKLVALLAFGSMLELFGISLLIPFFSTVLDASSENVISKGFSRIGILDQRLVALTLGLSIIGFFLAKMMLFRFTTHKVGMFSFGVYRFYSLKMYEFIAAKSLLFLRKTNSNSIIRDIEISSNLFAQNVIIPVLSIMTEMVLIVIIILLLLYFNWMAILFLLVFLLPPFIIYYNKSKNKLREIAKLRHQFSAESRAALSEAIQGQLDIRIYDRQDFFFNRYKSQSDTNGRTQVDLHLYKTLPAKIIETAMVAGIVMLFIFSIIVVRDAEKILMLITVFGVAAFRTLPSANRLLAAIIMLKGGTHLMPQMKKVADWNSKNFQGEIRKSAFKFQAVLKLIGVSFRYQNDQGSVVEDLNLTVAKGELIAIVGQSGSGKSTLLNIIMGLINPQLGSVEVDGKSLEDIGPVNWWRNIGYVQQDVFMMDATIAQNIKLDAMVTAEEEMRISEILKSVALSDFIQSLPLGIHTQAGERASLLSGGQRQRIAIARALFWQTSFIVYDEATSAVDAQTEAAINETIFSLKKSGITQIVVSHKESILTYCDRVYRMERGHLKAVEASDQV